MDVARVQAHRCHEARDRVAAGESVYLRCEPDAGGARHRGGPAVVEDELHVSLSGGVWLLAPLADALVGAHELALHGPLEVV